MNNKTISNKGQENGQSDKGQLVVGENNVRGSGDLGQEVREVRILDNGFIIIHKTDKSLKETNAFVNSLIQSLDLVKEGFHLLPV